VANRGTAARAHQRPAVRGPAAVTRLGLLVASEAAAIIVLHRLGAGPGSRVPWHHLGRWVAESQPEDAVWAVVRVIGLACAYWQLASTLAYVGARLSGVPRLVAGVRWACLPGVRRLVDGAVALSILGGALLSAGPARATTPTTVPPVVVQVGGSPAAGEAHAYRPVAAGDAALGQPATSTSTSSPPVTSGAWTATTTPGPRSTEPPSPGATPAPPVPPGRARAPEAATDRHEVVPGDNLWDIAAAHLAEATGRPGQNITNGEIASYWVRLMAANEGLLRSGNPNLIFPGERVICPPVDGGLG
jgi:hypothetical protein